MINIMSILVPLFARNRKMYMTSMDKDRFDLFLLIIRNLRIMLNLGGRLVL